ncbi:MAG TPA: serine protease [Candidatus Melainabacteria bacterium]|nr:serine protease [Candidatus Melainabacteria bacterium]
MDNQHKTSGVPENPDVFSAALANVIRLDGDKETIIGQAWKAAPNLLVTCGHVVEPFANSTKSLQIKFPASGNRYAVREVRLHPSFARQADQLVTFDAAILLADLTGPERDASALPITYTKELKNFQPLSAVRYPVHLGQYSSAPAPLAQLGRMLGELRRSDSYHILHDLALAAGDSGSPIFDDTSVVAIHCGDTASLPGLNLPTTSIRLALWVDALKELGVEENLKLTRPKSAKAVASPVLAFLLAAIVVFIISGGLLAKPLVDAWTITAPPIMPISVSFNKARTDYYEGEPLIIQFTTASDCFVHLFEIDGNKVTLIYPEAGNQFLNKAGHPAYVKTIGDRPIGVGKEPSKFLWVVLLNSKDHLLEDRDRKQGDDNIGLLNISTDELMDRIDRIAKEDPQGILHIAMDGPIATKPAPASEIKSSAESGQQTQ